MSRALILGFLLFLASCGPAPIVTPTANDSLDSLLRRCCGAVEVFPRALVALVEPTADRNPLFAEPLRLRPGHLEGGPGTWEHIAPYLQPLDILLSSDKGQVNGQFVRGFLTHALVYLGTEAQLRREGLWDHPALAPFHARIRAGEIFFEAMPPRVDFSDVANVMDVDAIAIWRAPLTRGDKREVLGRLLREYGKPFDMHMDTRTPDGRYCTELIWTAYPKLGLVQRIVYDRPVILPDEIAASAMQGRVPLSMVGFVHRDEGRIVSAPVEALAAQIGARWP